MGTDESHTNEWIEIYNFSSSPTDLTGWTITSADGKISISLKCTLAPHGVAVLERTDENTLPDITALLTYTGELVNSGTTLTVKDPSGNISNEVDSGGDNWLNIGGTNTAPKQTPQQTPSGWITAPPTPMGQATAGDAGTSNVTCPPPEEANEEEDNNTVATVTEKSGGGGGSAKRSSSSAPKENIPPKLALTIDGLKTAYVNQDVTFAVVPSGVGKTLESSLSYDWNLGDTYTEKGKNISHVFSYP
ncbi:MAG: lamin tail domain-containing protein, partial [Candidatus Kaiserbacteria bacterium]|nr:lamin tail domain-containing protein [Candidatus Kaiserbacteria bacterium]